MSDPPLPTPAPPSWPDARRIESFAGETRVNLLRLLALVVFYVRHLLDAHFHPATAGGAYHRHATLIVLVWSLGAILTHVLLFRRRFPGGLKYLTCAMDLAGVTLLVLASTGPRSPLLVLYFPIIASAPLRLSLRLVYVATFGSWVGYAILLMHYAWFQIGFSRYYATAELRIPRTEEALWLLALGTAGLFAGQVVRQARRLTAGYPVALAEQAEVP